MDNPEHQTEKQTIYWEGYDEGQKESKVEIEQLKNRVEDIGDYDPGILNDYGGGNINWWMGYIQTEIGKCNEHWRQELKED